MLKIIHSWPDASDAQDRLISILTTQGFGGVVCNVSFQDYLDSAARWESFTRAVTEARRAGMAMWLYDEKGYPSATAGGKTLKDHPEWQARGLLIAETNCAPGRDSKLQLPPGEPVLIAAYQLRDGKLDLATKTNLANTVSASEVKFSPSSGVWRLIAIIESPLYDGTHAAMSLADHIPYPNLLDPEPTAKFLELTHQRYADHLKDDLGKTFTATFTDEPSLMSLFLKPMPYRVLPWSRAFPAEFAGRRGHALDTDLLPTLLAETTGATAKFRYDFWKTVGELVSENFLGQIQQWCQKHSLLSGGHLLMEENLAAQVPLYGDFFQCLRRLDSPGIDCLTSLPNQVPWEIARVAASAGALNNRSLVMCETSDHSQRYRPAGDKRPPQAVSPAQIRGTCNRLFLGGVSLITSYYSFAELSNEQLRDLNTYVGRCCAVLQNSHPAAEIALVYPTESLWAHFTPSRHLANNSPAAARIESIFHNASSSLFNSGCDYTCIDSQAINESEIRGDLLVHGDLKWQVVILPGVDTLPLEAWNKLHDFVEAGGVLISIGAMPLNTDVEFPSAALGRMAINLFGKTNPGELFQMHLSPNAGLGIYLDSGKAPLLPQILDSVLQKHLRITPKQHPLRWTLRRAGNQNVFFVANDSSEPWSGTLTFPDAQKGERLDPLTGTRCPIPDAQNLSITLEPYGATFFCFEAKPIHRLLPRAPAIASSSARLLRPVQTGKPVVARGEFVREKLSISAGDTANAWDISATLTRSQVDTFLFARLSISGGLQLDPAGYLVLDTRVPEGQSTPAQLLLILHERGGADYLAETGRWLGTPGQDRTIVPLSRFALAGWSTDSHGQLDLADIDEIRVGWGGYYGQEGETISFTLSGLSSVLSE